MKAQHQKAKLEQMLKTPFYVASDNDNVLNMHAAPEMLGIKLNWSLNEDLTDYHEIQFDQNCEETTKIQVPAGKKLYIFCTEDQGNFRIDSGGTLFDFDREYRIGGNICFLTDSSCFKKTNFSPVQRTSLYSLFSTVYTTTNSSNLRSAGDCIIGYSSVFDCNLMFHGCHSLESAPLLPSTIVNYYAYMYMFEQCDAITDLHFQKSLENDTTFLAIDGAPKFGATNATVHFDL